MDEKETAFKQQAASSVRTLIEEDCVPLRLHVVPFFEKLQQVNSTHTCPDAATALVTCVVCDHSRAHTLDDDSLTLETSSDPLADARALSVMGLVYSGGNTRA